MEDKPGTEEVSKTIITTEKESELSRKPVILWDPDVKSTQTLTRYLPFEERENASVENEMLQVPFIPPNTLLRVRISETSESFYKPVSLSDKDDEQARNSLGKMLGEGVFPVSKKFDSKEPVQNAIFVVHVGPAEKDQLKESDWEVKTVQDLTKPQEDMPTPINLPPKQPAKVS